MVNMQAFNTAAEWLFARTSFIGGSDAASILGLSPWRTNVQLWEEKTGRRSRPNLDDSAVVQYGHAAESHLRELYALDEPQMQVKYVPHNMWTNTDIPFAHASLDGWLTDPQGRFGILEIKTATIQNGLHAAQWRDRIPDAYYCQVLHYFLVTEAEFAVVAAQLRFHSEKVTRYIHIERNECVEDICTLYEAEARFAKSIADDVAPPLILPQI